MLRRFSSQKGQGLVEFAVIFPIFALLIFVVVDTGLLMGRYNSVNHATKEGARLAAVGATHDEIVARIKTQSQGLLDGASENCPPSADKDICVEWIPGPPGHSSDVGQVGSSVKVSIRYKYTLITPLANGRIAGLPVPGVPDGFEVTACAVARLERPVADPDPAGTSEC